MTYEEFLNDFLATHDVAALGQNNSGGYYAHETACNVLIFKPKDIKKFNNKYFKNFIFKQYDLDPENYCECCGPRFETNISNFQDALEWYKNKQFELSLIPFSYNSEVLDDVIISGIFSELKYLTRDDFIASYSNDDSLNHRLLDIFIPESSLKDEKDKEDLLKFAIGRFTKINEFPDVIDVKTYEI